jgi:hypothetical protein
VQVSNAAILMTSTSTMPKLSALLLRLLAPYLLRVVDGEEAVDGDEQDGEDAPEDDGEGSDDGDESSADDADGEDAEGEEASEEDGEGPLVVSIGEEPEQPEDEKRAPDWLRDLRKSNREKDRRIRELESQISAGRPVEPQQIEVGKEPEVDDYETWTEEGKAKFKKDWADWNNRSNAAAKQKADRETAEQQQRESWQRTQSAYDTAKAALKVDHFEDAEDAVKDSLNQTQQGILLVAMEPKKAALMVYALGSAPKKLKELSAITDPIKFTVAITKLESEMKVSKTKAAPAPERVVRGNVAGAAAVDNQLERLRKEARESGDYSKVTAFKRQQAEKSRPKQSA